MNIKILSKKDTLKIISNETFISTWKYLAENTNHCTVVQEYGFVVSWYQSYLDKYKPMMVLGYDEQENVVGILPLAIAYDTEKLSFAGDNQAEYHSWICLKEYEEEFLVHSLITIKKEYKLGKWEWGWLPPGIDINWFDSDLLKKSGIYINSVSSKSPLYNLENTDKLHRMNKNKSNKIKMNRLKKEGELRIERIRDRDYAKKLLEIVINQYNFRHLALYNHIPFQSDKNKKEWHLNQMDTMTENTHFTVLWHGAELMACNIGCCTTDKVLVGLLSYDPIKGTNSPGNIFLIKLMEFVKEEGYKFLDLTPGGDRYKEHFCNEHVAIVKPTICFNQYNRIKNHTSTSLRNIIKKRYTARDLASIQGLIQKNISLLKIKVLEPRDSTPSYYVYREKVDEIIQNDTLPTLNRQRYADLLLYQYIDGILPHKELAYNAMKKFERGDRLYTMVSNKKLITFVWVAYSGKKHWRSTLKEKINLTKNSVFIYDFYTSDKARKNDIFQSCIQGIMKDIQNEQVSATYLVKPADINEETVNRAGFFSHPVWY